MIDIQHQLRNDIVSGDFAFGSRLIIEELAARYGVSHMPIRERCASCTAKDSWSSSPIAARGSGRSIADSSRTCSTCAARSKRCWRGVRRCAAPNSTCNALREAAARLEAHGGRGRSRVGAASPIASSMRSSTTLPAIRARCRSSTATGCCCRPAQALRPRRRAIPARDRRAPAPDPRDRAQRLAFGGGADGLRTSRRARTTCWHARPRCPGNWGNRHEGGDWRTVEPPAAAVDTDRRACRLRRSSALYWLMALRPGTNAALVPAPPQILAALIEEIGQRQPADQYAREPAARASSASSSAPVWR